MNEYGDSNRMVTQQVNVFGQKKGLITAILQNLGHEVPSNEELDKAIVEAARKIKSEAGLDPGPSIALSLVPLPAKPDKE